MQGYKIKEGDLYENGIVRYKMSIVIKMGDKVVQRNNMKLNR